MLRFVICDGSSGDPIGEILNAEQLKITRTLGDMCTASMVLRVDNPFFPLLMSTSERYICKVYQTVPNLPAQLKLCGLHRNFQLTSGDSNGTPPLGLSAINDPWWYMGKRYVTDATLTGQTINGYTNAGADRAVLAKTWIDNTNQYIGDTGIRTPSSLPTTQTIPISQWSFFTVADGIHTIANAPLGFEWIINPSEPVLDSIGLKLGDFQLATKLGTDKRDTVFFEYGCGLNNVDGYSTTIIDDNQANKIWHVTDQDPTNPVVSAQDPSSFTSFGVIEAEVGSTDIKDLAVRNSLLQANLRVRSNPQTIWNITPSVINPNNRFITPISLFDYDVGDLITCRIVENITINGKVIEYILLNATMRIYAITLSVDLQGIATPTLQLIPNLA
jgi:hypothetical protein